jgi:spermidine/putrescine ABC transporter ATP-binding subunit
MDVPVLLSCWQAYCRTECVNTDVELRHIAKSFAAGMAAVDDLSLELESGELISLLGPSGCGKTTTLRIIGGFISPDAGRVFLKGRDVTDLPPEKRDVGMVFQSYALFPHMTVARNVSYGLRMRRIPAAEANRRVAEALELVRLTGLADRYPAQLSGGQQQRVALARAIVIRPSVLLLDEPLSNLDAKLRQGMRFEIRQLQRRLGITTLFVTHDQEEALTLSDRVAVMNQGRIAQIGTPQDIYRNPRSLFIAEFIGEVNLIEGVIAFADTCGIKLTMAAGWEAFASAGADVNVGSRAVIAVRPENVHVFELDDATSQQFANRAAGVIEATTYLGPSTILHIRLTGGALVQARRNNDELASRNAELAVEPGDRVFVCWHASACRLINRP